MDMKQQLQNDLKEAMRARDETRKNTLRMALSEIRLAEVEKKRSLDESETMVVLQKQVKSRHETIEGAQQANRPDLIEDAEAEIAILEAYLPQPLTEDELQALASQAVEEAGATSMREMGQVMKILVPRLKGQATGKQASDMVRRLLS
jgi:uncharacterized protein YqeY